MGAPVNLLTKLRDLMLHMVPQLGRFPREQKFMLGNRIKPDAFREFPAQPPTAGMPWASAVLQSQRDCVLQPRVARPALPWVADGRVFNPNGVASRVRVRGATPLGLLACGPVAQGSSCLATLDFGAESLWDSAPEFQKGIRL